MEMSRETARRAQWLGLCEGSSETREEKDVRSCGGSALTPSITHLMSRCSAIVLLLRGNRRNLDFTVWALCFPLLGWHLFCLFTAVSYHLLLQTLMLLFFLLPNNELCLLSVLTYICATCLPIGSSLLPICYPSFNMMPYEYT